jgi:hypothetical protein
MLYNLGLSTYYIICLRWPALTRMLSSMNALAKTTVVRRTNDDRVGLLKSRISNHQDLLPNLDGRSAAARRFRDLVNSYLSDAGGIAECSEIRIGLIRRLAAVVVQSELLESRMVNGENVDTTRLCQLASTVVRISTRLGLERRQHLVPTLSDVLKG